MNEAWNDIIITKIKVAVYVGPNSGKHIHNDRPFHGLVLNDSNGIKDYVFDDGTVLHTKGRDIFYLPKGSSYYVKQHEIGGCYAINFDADFTDEPFCISFRNSDALLQSFKGACDAWMSGGPMSNALVMRTLYDGIYQMQKELSKQYVSGAGAALISPAIAEIEKNFNQSNFSVAHLARKCGISEVYLRRLFIASFGVSPKEYIIQKRIECAKSLLASGHFSISEVSDLCGYSEPCHFSREFKKRVGVAPTEYR